MEKGVHLPVSADVLTGSCDVSFHWWELYSSLPVRLHPSTVIQVAGGPKSLRSGVSDQFQEKTVHQDD